MKVFVVLADFKYEGKDLHAIYADENEANIEASNMQAKSRYVDYVVEEWEVRGADKEKAPASSEVEPPVCLLCRKPYVQCFCIPF